MHKLILPLVSAIIFAGALSAGEVSTFWVARYDGPLGVDPPDPMEGGIAIVTKSAMSVMRY